LDFLKSTGAGNGPKHMVSRRNIYMDVIELYRSDSIINECPLFTGFKGENAIDEGGVTRDMFSAFWEEAYAHLFDGAAVLVPLVDSSTDLGIFPILGKIISHGYLASGILPIRIIWPSLLTMILGNAIAIPRSIILDALMDYISNVEREHLKSASCYQSSCPRFPERVQTDVIAILSRLGCREIPTPSNLANLIEQVARFEFCCKPMGVIAMVNSGIPSQHRDYWQRLGVNGIVDILTSLTVSPEKVRSLFHCDCASPAEERIFGYLITMIDNMGVNDIRNFLRFITGSSVCVAESIKVCFNATFGFTRRPIANTCSNTLSLPHSYLNYHDFFTEWSAILSDTNKEWMWYMDAF
jgi:hypothetical protein